MRRFGMRQNIFLQKLVAQRNQAQRRFGLERGDLRGVLQYETVFGEPRLRRAGGLLPSAVRAPPDAVPPADVRALHEPLL